MGNLKNEVEAAKATAKQVEAANTEVETENNIELADYEIEYGERILSAIGYISFLCVLPLLAKPDSKLCQHHGRQGLVLAILSFLIPMVMGILWFILMIPTLAVGAEPFPLNGLIFLTQSIITLVSFYGIYLAFKKDGLPKIPVIGQLAKHLEW